MFGHLFFVRQYPGFGVRDGGVDGSFHRIGRDHTILRNFDERFGGEADEFPGPKQFVWGIGHIENLFECIGQVDGSGEGEVEQVGVAGANLFDHTVESLFVLFKKHGVFFKVGSG